MQKLLNEFDISDYWIDLFRVTVTMSMRQDVSTHSEFDDEFVQFGGPERVFELLTSNDPRKEDYASILINSMIPYHCPKTSKSICANGPAMRTIANLLLGDIGRRPVGWGFDWETRSTTINNFAFFAKYEENHPMLNSLELKEIFVAETHLADMSVATMSATIYLANLMGNREDKDDASLVSSKDNLDNLVYALSTISWLNWSWPPRTMAPPLRRLALNENNKILLREVGLLPVLLQNLRDERLLSDPVTLTELLLLTVNLAFNIENKEVMKTTGYQDALLSLSHDTRCISSHVKTIQQIFWILNPPPTTTLTDNKFLPQDQKHSRSITNSTNTSNMNSNSNKQIMISYNWGSQSVAIAVAEFLQQQQQQRSWKVWIDIEQMQGSTMEAMAQAVEDSDLIIVLVSRKYKESPNCRLEGEYSYQRHKDIIPLLVEPGYTADGWLGALLGTKLWYDFTAPTKFSESFKQLKRAIDKLFMTSASDGVCGARSKSEGSDSVVVSVPTNDTLSMSSFPMSLRSKVACASVVCVSWTCEEVATWIDSVVDVDVDVDVDIEERTTSDVKLFRSAFISNRMDGRAMQQLAIYSRRDGALYRELLEKLSFPMDRIGSFLRFTYNLENTFLSDL
eukprot:gene1806-3503_t